MAELIWARNQLDIFDDFATGKGHTAVIAVAGASKSTSMLEGVSRVSRGKRVLMCAFNVETAAELKRKLAERGLSGHVDARTTHGLGKGAVNWGWRAQFPQIEVDEDRELKLLRALLAAESLRLSHEDTGVVLQLVSFAKAWVLTDEAKLRGMAEYYDLRPVAIKPDAMVALARAVLLASLEPASHISYDDMIYIPVALGLRPKKYDIVVVDEAQDLARGQTELALMALKPGGRVIVCGDPKQAIYGFRGADSDSMARLTKRLAAKTLPLSITYRCARAVVDHVKPIVPQIEAAPHAQQGSAEPATLKDMLGQWAPGDFVLSRVNAPLVGLCLKAWRAGIRAQVLGKNVGAAVRELVNRYGDGTVVDLVDRVRGWRDRECDRLKAAEKEKLIDAVFDRAETLIALCEGMADVPSVRARIEALFGDEKKVDRETTLVFASTHKAKGLEAKRAWVLDRTYRPSAGGEEANLYYVACTRAKVDLRLVTWDPKASDVPRE